MNYIWILSNQHNEVMALFTGPELAFRSLERTYGIGIVKVIVRKAGRWEIRVKGQGVLRCVRRILLDKPVGLWSLT